MNALKFIRLFNIFFATQNHNVASIIVCGNELISFMRTKVEIIQIKYHLVAAYGKISLYKVHFFIKRIAKNYDVAAFRALATDDMPIFVAIRSNLPLYKRNMRSRDAVAKFFNE